MTLPASGAISLNQVNVELLRSATASINLNDSAVRTLAQVGGSGTQISMSSLLGKSIDFSFTILGGDQVNLRTLAIENGWNQVARLTAYNYGPIYSSADGQYALVISGSFPNGVTLINVSYINGKGGAGGAGAGPDGNSSGSGGGGGNTAINVTTPVTINNMAFIRGGGGGGGGAQSGIYRFSGAYFSKDPTVYTHDFCAAGGGGNGGMGGPSNQTGSGAGGASGGSYSNINVNWPFGTQPLDNVLYQIGLWNNINLAASDARAATAGSSNYTEFNYTPAVGISARYYYRRDADETETYYGPEGGYGGQGGFGGSSGANGGAYVRGNHTYGSAVGAGGPGGVAVQGDSHVTWAAFGTISGGRTG